MHEEDKAFLMGIVKGIVKYIILAAIAIPAVILMEHFLGVEETWNILGLAESIVSWVRFTLRTTIFIWIAIPSIIAILIVILSKIAGQKKQKQEEQHHENVAE